VPAAPSQTGRVRVGSREFDKELILGLLSQPARSLTIEEALVVVAQLHLWGELTIVGATFHVDDQGRLVFDDPDSWANHLRDPSPARRFPVLTFAPMIGGVEFGVAGRSPDPRAADVRLAVFMYKLARILRTELGIARIRHSGIDAGHAPHWELRAIDLYSFGWELYDQYPGDPTYYITRDWGDAVIPEDRLPQLRRRPRPDAASAPTPPRGARLELVRNGETASLQPAAQGSRPSNRWPVFNDRSYVDMTTPGVDDAQLTAYAPRAHGIFRGQRFRLDPGTAARPGSARTAQVDLPGLPPASRVFERVLQICAAEATDDPRAPYGPRANPPRYPRGQDYHPTIHPDAPVDAYSSQTHTNHIHVQVGPTSLEHIATITRRLDGHARRPPPAVTDDGTAYQQRVGYYFTSPRVSSAPLVATVTTPQIPARWCPPHSGESRGRWCPSG
jgi:hypothetical protein